MLEGCVPWPEEFALEYRRAGYWTGDTLGELSRRWARDYGDRVAIVAADRRWTYRELDARADRLAAGLHRLGIGSADRVVVQLPNVPEFVVLCLALFRLGALPVLALPPHRHSEITYLCRLSEAVAYVIPDVHMGYDYRTLAAEAQAAAPTLRHVLVAGDPGPYTSLDTVDAEPLAAAPAPNPRGVALFLLSGGTTGLPKLIPRTHNDYAYNVRASAEVCGLDRNSTYLVSLPVAHNFAFGCPGVLGTLSAGGKVVLAGSPSPDEAFPLIERERVTFTALVPPLALLWMDAAEWSPDDLSSLRLLQVGGAKFAREAAARVEPTLGCRLQQVFGMAEGLLNYTLLDDPEETVLSTQGRPLSDGDEIRIVDENDEDVNAGEVGELLTRGPYTLRGYYRAPEHNAKAFTPDGYYRTGDLVRRVPSGHLIVEGRVKDQINRGGDKVSAEEIEDNALAHPNVHDIAVVAMPDRLLGEKTCAYVVPRGTAPTLDELTGFLSTRGLAAYKLPDRLEVITSLPRTGVGKIDKKELASRITDALRIE
ncbi:(2,3-dihydroxybenzoyl)adenylate synthase [Actinomadura sp. SCN-SB]|uniref:(2,3-dihydroxybenzoyl)adenylate synthase n=1 Tax=Actinomadura sp. SCN-SB TaxID=3373092 RepID=UPI003750FDFB